MSIGFSLAAVMLCTLMPVLITYGLLHSWYAWKKKDIGGTILGLMVASCACSAVILYLMLLEDVICNSVL